MNYLTQADLIKLHNRVISVSGGLVGMRDVAILDSILSHMQNDEYYPDFFAKLSHLIFSINEPCDDQKKLRALKESVHNVLGLNFSGHKYAFVLHTHQNNPHVHVVFK